MEEELEEELETVADQQNTESFRKSVADRILLESDRLIDQLFQIVYAPDVEAKVKLTAISMLLDRGIPKLGVDHTKVEEVEESSNRKAIREEIEGLLKEGGE